MSLSDSTSSRKRARTESDPTLAAPEHTTPEEEEQETTNGHLAYPTQHHQQQQYMQHPQQPPPPQPQGELQPSFFGIEPYNDFTRKIGDWIWKHSKGNQHVEIEAKVGVLRDTITRQRIKLPVTTECVLEPSTGNDVSGLSYYFDSDMTLSQHKHFNKILNDQFQTSQKSPAPVLYSHLYETDTFHTITSASGREKKVRMRKNKKTGEVVDVVEKVRLGDLNVYCPGSKLDWRLSCSVEIPVPQIPTSPALQPRQKDRLSYSHQIVVVDLTQVLTLSSSTPPVTLKRHELEVEVKDVPMLLEEAKAFEEGEENTYDLLLGVMLSSVRMLVKNAA